MKIKKTLIALTITLLTLTNTPNIYAQKPIDNLTDSEIATLIEETSRISTNQVDQIIKTAASQVQTVQNIQDQEKKNLYIEFDKLQIQIKTLIQANHKIINQSLEQILDDIDINNQPLYEFKEQAQSLLDVTNLLPTVAPLLSSSTQEQIQNAKNQVQKVQEQLKQTEKSLEQINSQSYKSQTIAVNHDLQTATKSIGELIDQIEKVNNPKPIPKKDPTPEPKIEKEPEQPPQKDPEEKQMVQEIYTIPQIPLPKPAKPLKKEPIPEPKPNKLIISPITPPPIKPQIKPAHPDFSKNPEQVAKERLKNRQKTAIIVAKTKINTNKITVAASTIENKKVQAQSNTITSGAPVILAQNRTMIPLRDISRALTLDVKWDPKTRLITLQDPPELKAVLPKANQTQIQIPIDTNTIKTKGKEIKTDIKPLVRYGHTYLSIANVSKALGLDSQKDILWNPNTREVMIIRTIQR